MKLLRTTALTAALMTAAVPMLTSPAHAWGWGGSALTAPYYGIRLFGLRLRIWDRLQLPELRLRLSPRCPTPYLCHHCWGPAPLALLSLARPQAPLADRATNGPPEQ